MKKSAKQTQMQMLVDKAMSCDSKTSAVSSAEKQHTTTTHVILKQNTVNWNVDVWMHKQHK